MSFHELYHVSKYTPNLSNYNTNNPPTTNNLSFYSPNNKPTNNINSLPPNNQTKRSSNFISPHIAFNLDNNRGISTGSLKLKTPNIILSNNIKTISNRQHNNSNINVPNLTRNNSYIPINILNKKTTDYYSNIESISNNIDLINSFNNMNNAYNIPSFSSPEMVQTQSQLSSIITQSRNQIPQNYNPNTYNTYNPSVYTNNNVNVNVPQQKPTHPSLSLPPSTKIDKFLPPQSSKNKGKKTLILDLDETLVHSGISTAFPISTIPDIKLHIDLDNKNKEIFVLVRPGVDEFLLRMSKKFEIVIFTASVSKYANPLIDIIDKYKVCEHRLFREHCVFVNGSFIKDLMKLNREIKNIILVDNSPIAFLLHPQNGLPIKTWFDDKSDRELLNISPIIEFLSYVNDVRDIIPRFVVDYKISLESAIMTINEYNDRLKMKNYNLQKNKIKNSEKKIEKPIDTKKEEIKKDIKKDDKKTEKQLEIKRDNKPKKDDKKIDIITCKKIRFNSCREKANKNIYRNRRNNTSLLNNYMKTNKSLYTTNNNKSCANMTTNYNTNPNYSYCNNCNNTGLIPCQKKKKIISNNFIPLPHKNPNMNFISKSNFVNYSRNQRVNIYNNLKQSNETLKYNTNQTTNGIINNEQRYRSRSFYFN